MATAEIATITSKRQQRAERWGKRGGIGALMALGLVAAGAASAEAHHQPSTPAAWVLPGTHYAECNAESPATICPAPTEGNNVIIAVNLGRRYSEISQLCFTTTFRRNGLDPGEQYDIQGYGGVVNNTSVTLFKRQNCFEPHPENGSLSAFYDGQEIISLYAVTDCDSFRVNRMFVSVIGTLEYTGNTAV